MTNRAILGLIALAIVIVGAVLYNLPDPVEQVNAITPTADYQIELAYRRSL